MDEETPMNPPASADNAPPPTAEDQEKLETKKRRTSMVTIIVIAAVLTSFTFQGFAIGYNVEVILVLVSGISAILVSGTAAAKQIIMQRMDTLRAVHNKIRMQVNRFMLENNKLTRNVDGLEDQVIQLQHLEQHLSTIAEQQSSSANELVALVKENKAILEQQKIMAKAELQEQLLATVLRTDRDGDLQIDEREANILIMRMKNYDGVLFDEDRVRKALVTTNGSLPALLNIIREIACAETDDEEEGEESMMVDESMNLESIMDQSNEKRMVKIDDRRFMESIRHQYSSGNSMLFSSMGESRLMEEGVEVSRRSLLGGVSKSSLMTTS